MRTVVLLLLLLTALEARAKPDVIPPPVPAAAARSKVRRRANPLRCLRRLGAAEVNLALRVSSWGIPSER